jgi:signal transduction histidine kinase
VLGLAGWTVALAGLAGIALQARSQMRSREALLRACHELRGPITAARLAVAVGARSGALSADRLQAIDLELEHATLAVCDLTAVATRIEPIPALEKFDLQALLADLSQVWTDAAQARGVTLEVVRSGRPAEVRADRLRIGQTVGNLLANAIEHGGGMVQVRAASDGVTVRVEVADDGPGLPAPVAEIARNAHKGRGARGRGLAIAASIAEGHGGRLAAAPSERGAKVVLELPAAITERTAPSLKERAEGQG